MHNGCQKLYPCTRPRARLFDFLRAKMQERRRAQTPGATACVFPVRYACRWPEPPECRTRPLEPRRRKVRLLRFHPMMKSAPAPLLLLSKPHPLRWAVVWVPPTAAFRFSYILPAPPEYRKHPLEPILWSRPRRRLRRTGRAGRSPAPRTAPAGRSRT